MPQFYWTPQKRRLPSDCMGMRSVIKMRRDQALERAVERKNLLVDSDILPLMRRN
jgi:hypothetical protein